VSIGPEQLTPTAVRDAVRSVLTDPSYRNTAHQLADELAALPEPADVAHELRARFGNG
jgi:UDP:flavonoid glycosyltransferase YjiC (YdhE family)